MDLADRYFVNPLAVIFIPEEDRKNNFSTIVFNPETENILKINRFGYKILEAVDKNPGLNLSHFTSNENGIVKFVDKMVKENIILKS